MSKSTRDTKHPAVPPDGASSDDVATQAVTGVFAPGAHLLHHDRRRGGQHDRVQP